MTRRLRITVLLLFAIASSGWQNQPEVAILDGPIHDGVEITCDLPQEQRVQNFGAPGGDHAGLCVPSALDMAARWHNRKGLIDVVHKIQIGGGWPERVDKWMKEYDPEVEYRQYEGVNPEFVRSAISRGQLVCTTYGQGELYRSSRNPTGTISHWVVLVHIDDNWAAIIDSNFVDKEYANKYFWMSSQEYWRRACHGLNGPGKAWVFAMEAPPPPPVPEQSL